MHASVPNNEDSKMTKHVLKANSTFSYLSCNILFKYIKGRICIMMSWHIFCIRPPADTLCYLPCNDVLFYIKLLSKNVVQAYILIMPAQKRHYLQKRINYVTDYNTFQWHCKYNHVLYHKTFNKYKRLIKS